jgi:short-subunit dehydrogenase
MRDLRNSVVVITGASSGFGKGVALKFAGAGAHLVLASRRRGLLKDLARQCHQLGVEALAVETDVSDSRQIKKLADRAVDEFGRIDIWVNNAGVGTLGRFDEAPLKDHEQVIRTNLLGTMYGSYSALREFRKQGSGVLINVASFVSRVAAPYFSSYSASKFGIRGLDMALRQELEQNGERSIRVCTVMPTSMDTPFFEHAGNYTGKPVKPIPPVYDPREVIDVIYELALNPRDEVIVGRYGKFGGVGARVAPKLFEKQMGKQAHKSQMEQAGSARNSSGSVLNPVRSGTEVYGGWLEGQRSGGTLKTVLGIGVPIGIALALWARRRIEDREQLSHAA